MPEKNRPTTVRCIHCGVSSFPEEKRCSNPEEISRCECYIRMKGGAEISPGFLLIEPGESRGQTAAVVEGMVKQPGIHFK